MLVDRRAALYLTVWLVCALNVALIVAWSAVSPAVRAALTTGAHQPTLLGWLLGGLACALLAAVDGSRGVRALRPLLAAAVFALIWGVTLRLTLPEGERVASVDAQPWAGLTLLLPLLVAAHRRLAELPVWALLRLGPLLREQGAALRDAGFTPRRHLFWPATSRHVVRGEEDIVIHVVPGTEAGRPLTARWLERRADLIALRPGARHVLWVALRAPQQPYDPVWWAEPGVDGVTVIGDGAALQAALQRGAARPPHAAQAAPDAPGLDAAQVRARGARFLSSVPLLLTELRGVGTQQLGPAHFVLTAGEHVVTLLVWPHPDAPSAGHPDAALFGALERLAEQAPGARIWAPLLVDASFAAALGDRVLRGGVPAIQDLFVAARPPEVVTEDSAYAALGLRPGASLPEVKAAYRRIIKECHPDRTQHLRGGERDAAHARARAVNAAYAQLSGRSVSA